MKKIIVLFLFLGISNLVFSQKLVVHHLDENGKETSVETYQLGDFIVIGHAKKGKKLHYFEGKITGIFQNSGETRLFDYARRIKKR